MIQEKDSRQIMRDFGVRKGRQFLAIAVTLLFLLILVLVYKHPDLIGELSKDTVFAAQVVLVATFIGFSAFNWRCPSCKKYLGNDISRRICKNCGTRLR